jgi:RND family efflux transporter MFP subunit
MRLFPLFLSAALLASCTTQPDHGGGHQMPPPMVDVAKPILRTIAQTKDFTGVLEAVDVVQISPQVSGLITQVHVADGAMVKAGERILSIDDRPFVAAHARARAEVARAEAELNRARLQLNRSQPLAEERVISRQQLDDDAAQVKISEASVAAAQAALQTAQLDLGYTTITAPVSGRIGKILTTVGNQVQGGGPVPPTHITTLVSLDPIYAVFDVDEATWQKIGAGLRNDLAQGKTISVQVGMTGDAGFPHVGKITFIDNRIEGTSGALRLRAQIANPNHTLTPGAFARVQLPIDEAKPTLLVHERALLSQLTTRYVLGVKNTGETEFRPVTLGQQIGDLRVVTWGLTADDTIVTTGQAKVFYPGMAVAPHMVAMDTLKAPEAKSETEAKTEIKAENPAPATSPAAPAATPEKGPEQGKTP